MDVLNLSVPRCMVCGRLLVQNVAVTSREGRVSRNGDTVSEVGDKLVTSREGRVSRNGRLAPIALGWARHVPRGTCE